MKLLESIRFENSEFSNLEFHQQRMNSSRKALDISKNEILLQDEIVQSPAFQNVKNAQGLFKCRIIYAEKIEIIEFVPYKLTSIQSLKILADNNINYAHKYANRSHLQKLFSHKESCDDILIVKNGFVTDTSFANIIFFNGKSWITPSKPLLKGTQRQFLLETEKISTAEIRPVDLKNFEKARMVNAMIHFEDAFDILIKSICS